MFELEKILVQENNSKPSFNSDLTSKRERTYVEMAIEAIAEYNEEVREGTKNFYTSLLESDDSVESITESFSGFFKKIAELIKKFLKFIQKMFDKFIIQLNGIIKSDKYLKKHKDSFRKFTSDNEFSYTGFKFTIEPGIPKNEFYYITDTYSYSSNNDTSKAIENFKSNYINALENDYEDNFRAWVINKEGKIDSADFSEELFSLFRNGDTSAYEFNVDKTVIDDAYHSFSQYDKLTKSVTDEKKKLDNTYNQRKKEIESFDKSFKEADYEKFVKTYIDPNASNITRAHLTDNDINNISLIMKAKADEVTKAMDIHGLAFAAKLDAIKSRYVQDKTILYKALYKLGIRESGMLPDLDDLKRNIIEEEKVDITEFVDSIELVEEGANIIADNKEVFIEGEYDILDFVHPTKELLDICTEKGILQIVDGEENAFSSEIFPDDIAYKIGIEDTPNPNNISYDIFVATEAMKDAELYAFINETILEASGEITNEAIEFIHENLADSIKNTVRKIWNAIVTMWNKFSQSMEELFAKDVKYLEKYKDIILKKKVKIESIQCNAYFDNDHGVKVAISNNFNIQDPDTNKMTENVDEYYVNAANTFLNRIHSRDKIEKISEFQDAIKKQLEGPEEVTYKTEQIQANMKNMYDFCHEYKNGYKKSAKDLLNHVDKKCQELEREIERASSSIKESTLLEFEINKGGEKTADNKSGATTNTTGSAYSQVNKDDKNVVDKENEEGKKSVEDITNDKEANADEKKEALNLLKEMTTGYLNYASAILGAKMSFGEAAYRDYMKIIKAHVRMYAKNPEANLAANNTTEEKNTDVKDVKPAEKVDRQKIED